MVDNERLTWSQYFGNLSTEQGILMAKWRDGVISGAELSALKLNLAAQSQFFGDYQRAGQPDHDELMPE